MGRFSRKMKRKAGTHRRKDRLACTQCGSHKLIRAEGMFDLLGGAQDGREYDTIQCISCDHVMLIPSDLLEE